MSFIHHVCVKVKLNCPNYFFKCTKCLKNCLDIISSVKNNNYMYMYYIDGEEKPRGVALNQDSHQLSCYTVQIISHPTSKYVYMV